MLCDLCWFMLRGQEGFQWKGTYDLHFKHHETVGTLRASAKLKCSICRILRDTFPEKLESPSKISDEKQLSVTARLSVQQSKRYNLGKSQAESENGEAIPKYDTGMLYRLDFRLECDSFRGRRTFILKEIGDRSLKYRTDVSNNTSSEELFELASYWINECNCVKNGSSQYPEYPKRLISWVGDVVKLVETADWKGGRPPGRKIQYVTLSHRWGRKKPQIPTPGEMLSKREIEHFKEGLKLETLPKTFRDAIHFASRLEAVGYIWIDSLCILQGQDENYDWLSQSVQMDKVYGESYLNISATAAENDDKGLFFERSHELLWGDEINLDVGGIPGVVPDAVGSRKPWTDQPDLRRCVILDASFWDELVNKAPVNKRGWVLQERVMAPRVLHFCKDQIAWECFEHNRAESLPLGIPTYQLRFDEIVDGRRLKGLGEMSGQQLRESRLHGGIDPERHLQPQIYAFELWKQIVEVYSMTDVTEPEDKIVALSGIARRIATQIGTKEGKNKPAKYVAGLWRQYLESQLLWRVETVFHHQSRTFQHPSTRPKSYRAPSFSWASVDTHKGSGMVYGEVTDQDLLIEIIEVKVEAQSTDRPYGLVKKEGCIVLRGVLRRIRFFLFAGYGYGTRKDGGAKMEDAGAAGACTGHVGWRLQEMGDHELEAEEHANVYLDCFRQDRVLDSERTYCLPVARGPRIDGEEYLICLLLEDMEAEGRDRGTFRRIGLTKLSPWGDKHAYRRMLDLCKPHPKSDQTEGRLICMI